MTIALVSGQKAALGGTGAATTIVVSFPAPTTAGSLLVVHCGAQVAVSGVTDDKSGGSNVWLKAVAEPGPDTGSSEIWYSYNAGACQTVTVTFVSSSGFRFASVSEFAGARTATDPKDKTDSDLDAGTSPLSITTPDVAPIFDGSLIFVAGRSTGAGPCSPNAPFTLLSQSGQADCDGYNIQTVSSPTYCSIDNTGSTHWVAQVVVFMPPAVAGVNAAVGTGVIDFGATPSEEATATVTGQAGLVAATHIEAWFQHGDSTSDNGVNEHEEAAAVCPLSCKKTVDGSFEVKAMPISALGIGTFKFHFAWSN